MKLNVTRLVVSIFICQLAGAIGSVFTVSSIPTWYASLAKPTFAPPNWIFGPVWLTLYTLMGMSLYLLWNKAGKSRMALYSFGLQLALNATWSIVFFGFKSLLGGLVIIVAMLVAIAATIVASYQVSRKAAWLLAPYIIWVSIAMLLNFYVWQLN